MKIPNKLIISIPSQKKYWEVVKVLEDAQMGIRWIFTEYKPTERNYFHKGSAIILDDDNLIRHATLKACKENKYGLLKGYSFLTAKQFLVKKRS